MRKFSVGLLVCLVGSATEAQAQLCWRPCLPRCVTLQETIIVVPQASPPVSYINDCDPTPFPCYEEVMWKTTLDVRTVVGDEVRGKIHVSWSKDPEPVLFPCSAELLSGFEAGRTYTIQCRTRKTSAGWYRSLVEITSSYIIPNEASEPYVPELKGTPEQIKNDPEAEPQGMKDDSVDERATKPVRKPKIAGQFKGVSRK